MNALGKTSALAAVGLAVLGSALVPDIALAQTPTYLAVGDSLAYGYQNDTLTPPGLPGAAGYPGYTKAYDAFLSQQAGTPIKLINLGIVGETTSSLLNTTTDNGALNANYTGTTSQFSLLTSELKNSQLQISDITVQIGANDILGLAESQAFQQAFAANNQAAEQQLLGATLASIESNDNALLTQINHVRAERQSAGSGLLRSLCRPASHKPGQHLPASGFSDFEQQSQRRHRAGSRRAPRAVCGFGRAVCRP